MVLIASGLWLAQGSPLKAMDEANFYKDSDHPLTQENLKKKGLSGRLKKIKTYIDFKRKGTQNYNPKEISKEDFEEYKHILSCTDCKNQSSSDIQDLHLQEICYAEPLGPGYGGAELYKFFDKTTTTPVIIKKFYEKERIEKGIDAGIEELVYSLIALEMNPDPQKLKMVRIYDAILCPKDCLSIMMECAKGEDIPAS